MAWQCLRENDLDSILTLVFLNNRNGAEIEMVHVVTHIQFISDKVYWQPIKTFIKHSRQ